MKARSSSRKSKKTMTTCCTVTEQMKIKIRITRVKWVFTLQLKMVCIFLRRIRAILLQSTKSRSSVLITSGSPDIRISTNKISNNPRSTVMTTMKRRKSHCQEILLLKRFFNWTTQIIRMTKLPRPWKLIFKVAVIVILTQNTACRRLYRHSERICVTRE